jgi:hypothetical protein
MNTIKHKFDFLVAHRTCTTPLEYILEILPKCTTNGPWIAGGALLRTYTGQPLDSDVDVFFQSQEQMTQFISQIALNAYTELDEDRNSSHYTIKDNVVSDWHTTITINYMQRDYKIQCVSFFYFKDVGELFDSFDFDVCMLAYDGESIHVSESTMDAINNKKIVLKKINYPSITLKRLVKYMRQGYDINDNDVMMLARSFRGFKEPKGILDEHFGITAFSKKSIGQRSDDYKALVTPL